MTHLLVKEQYGSLEWIGEDLCGLDKDCIVVPDFNIVSDIQNVEDYVEIQVTEEEVISEDHWASPENGHVDDPLSFRMDDVVVPLPEQNEFSSLNQYPCDFCSRRFSKKSALTSHMVTHQVDKWHPCNMCGEKYRKKLDLVEHMKVHAQAPNFAEEDEDCDLDLSLPQIKVKQRTRRKKKSLNRKRQSSSPMPVAPQEYIDEEEEDEEDEDENSMEIQNSKPRFPIIDPNRPYVCQHCGVGFAREKALISHNMVHIGDSAYECEHCHDMFANRDQLADHIAKIHRGSVSSNNVSNERVVHHLVSVKKEENCGTFQCEHCGLSFRWYNQLKKHRKTHVVKLEQPSHDELYLCTACNVSFLTHEELNLHKEQIHASVLGLNTCICGQMFDRIEDLYEHMKLSHHKTTSTCRICGSAFKDTKSLYKHMVTHEEVHRTYSCQICTRRFQSRSKLKRHTEMFHEDKVGLMCVECGEDFPDGKALILHRQDSHGIDMSKLFPCLECGKTFSSRSSQQIHVRIHTGEKPYGCRFCWKAFADGGTLRKHERIHTGEKPYVCPVCSKAFNQRVVLREHVRAHHSGAESRLTANCFECIVCGQMFGSSTELCHHLVQHSDENTAKHRLPSNGTRRYGKRKVPPLSQGFPNGQSLKTLSPEVEAPAEPSPAYPKDKKLTHSKAVRIQNEPTLTLKTEEDSSEEKASKKARIVRSGRKGYPKGSSKRYVKGKGKSSRLTSNASYASKYAVTRTEEESIDYGFDVVTENGESSTNGYLEVEDDLPRSRPRTKNVNYHNMRPEKLPLATFPLLEDPPPDLQDNPESAERKSTGRSVKKELDDCDPTPLDSAYINGIDPNLFDDNHGSEIETCIVDDIGVDSEIDACIVDDIGVELKLEVKTSEPDDFLLPESIMIKSELISCEMCSEVFTNRSDLLKHIQIHI